MNTCTHAQNTLKLEQNKTQNSRIFPLTGKVVVRKTMSCVLFCLSPFGYSYHLIASPEVRHGDMSHEQEGVFYAIARMGLKLPKIPPLLSRLCFLPPSLSSQSFFAYRLDRKEPEEIFKVLRVAEQLRKGL